MARNKPFTFIYCLMIFFFQPFFLKASPGDTTVLKIKKTTDFDITGNGSADNWNGTEWLTLLQRKNTDVTYKTQVKLLYSETGIYCLYHCEDSTITAALKGDFLNLFREDVVEAFFHTDETIPIYFEYELSPLNYELAILVPNFNGKAFGWTPWHYEGDRKTKHVTSVKKTGDNVASWTAEFFIPFKLLSPMTNVPPKSGTKWRANFYRIDYDRSVSQWSWQLTRTNFHDYERFGTIIFD